MAWFMIAGINHQWAATIERLAGFDRSQAFDELDVALKALPGDVPDVHRAVVAHWLGKVALLNNAIAEAIPPPTAGWRSSRSDDPLLKLF